MEIPFAFDTLGGDTERLWDNNAPPPAEAVHAAGVTFATHGNPGWPKYERSRRTTKRFDTTPEVVDDPRSAGRALWAEVR